MSIKTYVVLFLSSLFLTSWQASADGHMEKAGVRHMEMSVAAEIVAIDMETRELSLKTPMGEVITVTAGEQIKRLGEFKVGDSVVTTYVASLEGDLRKPTEEELENPWVELDAAGIAGIEELPGVAAGRIIQAVVTIEGMNRILGTVTVMDPRGKLHLIGDVEPEKMEGVLLGDTIIVTYTEAIAITLERDDDAS
jgi:hypothetical protein